MTDRGRWLVLLAELGIQSGEDVYDRLIEAYSEPHRSYHSLQHISDCLSHFDAHSELMEKPHLVEMAIWFHDSIYKPFSDSNEEDSAAWARDFLTTAELDDDSVSIVSGLILATKHDSAVLSDDASVLVDIDLTILGAETSVYERYETDIREEYKLVPKFLFRDKRAQLLQSFLARETIYANEAFRALYEEKARQNLSESIERLTR